MDARQTSANFETCGEESNADPTWKSPPRNPFHMVTVSHVTLFYSIPQSQSAHGTCYSLRRPSWTYSVTLLACPINRPILSLIPPSMRQRILSHSFLCMCSSCFGTLLAVAPSSWHHPLASRTRAPRLQVSPLHSSRHLPLDPPSVHRLIGVANMH